MATMGPEGMIFANKYRITKLIGRGGMANVYLAVDMGTGIKVAIKILKPEFSADEEFIRRFDTEAKAVSSLNHSNIVKVFGVGHENNFRYIIQEYVEGITVKELINQNGHLDWKVAVPIVIQVGMALEYAHKNGIVHRDIKPQNILISRDRIAKITDFGIARASTGNTITMTSGGAMGSVHYFSPEQARGGNVGPSSDIYSVGIMLFEMITGRVPYDGDSNVAIAVKHLQDRPPYASSFVPDIPSGLDSIILKCMQKTPDKRYSSMRQMVTELDALMVDPNGVYGVISNEEPVAAEVPQNVSFRQDPNYEKIADLEKSAEARRRSRFRDNVLLVLIVVVIVGVLIGLGTLVVSSIRNATNIEVNNDFVVENYCGLSITEVKTILEANHINYTVEYYTIDPNNPNDEGLLPNIVIAQSIAEGMTITAGSSIHPIVLTVTKAADAVALDDYSGQDYHSVYTILVNQRYNVTIVAETNEDVEPDTVLRTEPPAGTLVSEGDSIVIVYAKEPTSSTVPEIVGVNLAEARNMVSEASLVLGGVDGAPEVLSLPEDQQFVIVVSPGVGTAVPRRSTINIIVGTYEDSLRGGTPTPTPVAVTINATASGGGNVTGSGTYAPGDTVTLTASAPEGYTFHHWLNPNGQIVSYDASFSFTVPVPASNPDPNAPPVTWTYTAVFSYTPTPTPTPVPPPPQTQPTDPNPPANP